MAEVMAAAGGMAVTLVRPLAAAAHASGVILYMDAFGPRPALVAMAERIASWGHVVLVPDLFYRFGAYGPFDPATGFSDPTVRGQLIGMIGATSQDMTVQDTGVLLGMLADAGATGPTGTVGYCLGGGRALTAAAAYPDRIKATASFHGGNLANDQPDSPHLRVGAISGLVYVGSAATDRSFPPEQSAKLEQALRGAQLDYVMENYAGVEHGWCVPDQTSFHATAAARHWRRLEALFGEGL